MLRIHLSRSIKAVSAAASLLLLASLSGAQTKTALSNAGALYARAIRLSHNSTPSNNGNVVVSVTAFPGGVGEEDIYNSTDNGKTFTQIGAVKDADFKGGLCCGTLYELPSAIGALPAGTLLWSGSVGQSSTTQFMQLKVYSSTDAGKTWTYLSNCATSTKIGSASGGLWEPEFTVANDGALVCFYSDETQTGHSQLLEQTRSYDGKTWQAPTYMVASTVASDRPGMAVVSKLPSGVFFMTYELCGPAACTVFYRTSLDGWNWGTSTNVGTKIQTATGQYFEHAPYNVWSPSVTSANGTILLVGQMMYESNGTVSSGNGVTIFANHSADGSGTWTTMPAPVQVPTAYNNYCPNYSSPLLPSTDGTTVLELASDYVGTVCTMYYATGPIIAGTQTATLTAAPSAPSVASNAALALSVTASGTASPVPTGTVVLTNGSYASGTLTLSNGSASTTIAANTFTAGSKTITATYSGDANYLPATLNIPLTVTAPPTFAVASSNVTVTAGATSANTSTITLTPSNGFTGSVALSAQVTSGPTTSYAPTFTFTPSSTINVSGSSATTATLTIATTARKTSALHGTKPLEFLAFAGLLPLFLARRRFRRVRSLALVALLAAATVQLTGCGGSSSSSSSTPVTTGTPAGTYFITVTATSSSLTQTAQLTLTVQ